MLILSRVHVRAHLLAAAHRVFISSLFSATASPLLILFYSLATKGHSIIDYRLVIQYFKTIGAYNYAITRKHTLKRTNQR